MREYALLKYPLQQGERHRRTLNIHACAMHFFRDVIRCLVGSWFLLFHIPLLAEEIVEQLEKMSLFKRSDVSKFGPTMEIADCAGANYEELVSKVCTMLM